MNEQHNNGVCPSCGYCPHCGRGGHQVMPWYPMYPTYPWYQPVWIGSGTVSVPSVWTDSPQPNTTITTFTGGSDVNYCIGN